MALNQIMFFILSAIIILFSVLTITSRKILRAAVYLLFVLVATSGLYFMLNYEFMAAVQLTLYAGGIVVLIIFSILLTSHISHNFEKPSIGNVIAGLLAGLVGCALSIWAVFNHTFIPSDGAPLHVDMKEVGFQLLSSEKNGYALPFEVISILLLAAMIGAIVVAKKNKQD